MPRDTTAEDIAKAYFDGWKLGLKALAIYRDGSKESQPLSTSTEGDKAAAAAASAKPRRERLPDTRQSITHKFNVAGHEGYITVGLFPDGRPGELFITMAKEGSTIGGLMDAFGTSVSMSLQYGVPLEDYVRKFSHMRFEPQGYTKNPDIRIAKSLIDYIFRWLGITFLPGYKEASMGVLPAATNRATSRTRMPTDSAGRSAGRSEGCRMSGVRGQGQSIKPRAAGRGKARPKAEVRQAQRRRPHRNPSPQPPAPSPQRPHQRPRQRQRPTATATATATATSAPRSWPAPACCSKTPARTPPAASNSPTSNRTPRPATTAARSPSATATATSATTAAAAWDVREYRLTATRAECVLIASATTPNNNQHSPTTGCRKRDARTRGRHEASSPAADILNPASFFEFRLKAGDTEGIAE